MLHEGIRIQRLLGERKDPANALRGEPGEIPVEITLADYREVDGVMVPFRTMETMLMQQMLTTVASVEHNAELPAVAFEPPDEVTALLAKAATADSGSDSDS